MVPPVGASHADRWERDERALWRTAPGLVVLLGPNDEAPFSLRGTGVALWTALEQPRTLSEVVADLAACFDASPDVVLADAEPVVARLAESGAIRRLP